MKEIVQIQNNVDRSLLQSLYVFLGHRDAVGELKQQIKAKL
ncbi:hypothetical protein [Leptolyngbya sp. DQ-M1]